MVKLKIQDEISHEKKNVYLKYRFYARLMIP